VTATPESGNPETPGHTVISVQVDASTRAVLEAIRRQRGPAATLDGVVSDALRWYAAEWQPGGSP
jgi:hypothetical protein